MMRKIIQLDQSTRWDEPTVQLVSFAQDGGLMQKNASESTAAFLDSVQPKEGKTYVLVLAMSAHEYYGPNSNKDSFPESPVPGFVEEGETLRDAYPTFEQHAGIYKHHKNSDPKKSMGKVVKAFYNDTMHRVELLLELDNEKAADIVKKINAGEYPPVSMGCRVPYDVCSVCRHKAKNLREYCEHTRLRMGEIDPATGKQVFVYNPSPLLFDISFVLRPADKIAYMMKKVASPYSTATLSAELGETVKISQLKASAMKKLSDIDKVVSGQVVDSNDDPRLISFSSSVLPQLVEKSPPMSADLCDSLSQLPLSNLFSTLRKASVLPTGKEMAVIIIRRGDQEASIPPGVLDLISALQGPVRSFLSEFPEVIDALESKKLLEDGGSMPSDDLIRDFKKELESRETSYEGIHNRAQSGGLVSKPGFIALIRKGSVSSDAAPSLLGTATLALPAFSGIFNRELLNQPSISSPLLAMLSGQEFFPSISIKTASYDESRNHHLLTLKKAASKSNLIASLVALHYGHEKVASNFNRYFVNAGDPVDQGPVRLESLIHDIGQEVVRVA